MVRYTQISPHHHLISDRRHHTLTRYIIDDDTSTAALSHHGSHPDRRDGELHGKHLPVLPYHAIVQNRHVSTHPAAIWREGQSM